MDLPEGMSQVANNARMAGISMEKLLGYLAAVGETTGGSASSIGTTLSTIFTRMGNIKLSKLDSYSNDGEDLSNVETVLGGKGIKLRDSVNEFRNFGDVLDDVASRWESFDSVSQRAIASAIAGVRQYEEFAVLMNNYGKATEYTAVATNSSGTAMQKFGYHLESVSAKEAKATAAFELLSDTVLNSDLVGGFYDTKAGLLGFLTGIVENLGLIPTLLTAVTAAASFKKCWYFKREICPSPPSGCRGKNPYMLGTEQISLGYSVIRKDERECSRETMLVIAEENKRLGTCRETKCPRLSTLGNRLIQGQQGAKIKGRTLTDCKGFRENCDGQSG